jgi:hypothetical protein
MSSSSTSNEVIVPDPLSGLADIGARAPALFLKEGRAAERFFDFFTANIRNKHTRRAYYNAACRFSDFCAERGVLDLARVKPVHVAGYVEGLLTGFAKPTIKQHLAAIRMLLDWLVVGQVIEVNPAHAVRGPKASNRFSNGIMVVGLLRSPMTRRTRYRAGSFQKAVSVWRGKASSPKFELKVFLRPSTLALTEISFSTSPVGIHNGVPKEWASRSRSFRLQIPTALHQPLDSRSSVIFTPAWSVL